MINPVELPELFSLPRLGKPLCLDRVIQEMQHYGHRYLMTQAAFEKAYPIKTMQPNWSEWISSWFHAPTHAIVMPTVDQYARIIIQQHTRKPLCSVLDHLLSFDEFRHQFRSLPCYQQTCVQLSDLDLWLLLRYLVHHYGVAVERWGQMTVIKMPSRMEQERAVISEEEKAIVQLKTTCAILHQQIDQLETTLHELWLSAKEHYTFNKKAQAVYRLKKMKKLEGVLEERYKTLDTMETVLLKIEAAQNDLQVIQAFNLGTETLRTILANHPLDQIEDTMDRLKDTLEEQHQIETAMESHTNDEEEEELEQQLLALQLEDKPVLTKPIDTQSELMRLQHVLSTLQPVTQPRKQPELA
ncbi:Snf7-domain-containing protein [Choanephora cucurbitarum]|nr:Snf7-domain-containing protein [Choanephora cucurbitarum]